MKILFSNMPWFEPNRYGIRAGSRWPFTTEGSFKLGKYLPYPFFMGYASSYVSDKLKNCTIILRDSIAIKESYEEFFNYIKKEKFDFIFVEISTPSLHHDIEIIKKIHSINQNTKIVLTGPPCSSIGKNLLEENDFIFSCICGEYEKGSLSTINGRSGLIDFDFLSTYEMNNSPFPTFDDTYVNYFDAGKIGQKHPHIQIMTSRGCPYKCVFCVWPATMTGNDPDGNGFRKVRLYSKDYMMDFLSYMKKRFIVKTIYIDDDTFNITDTHVLNMCDVFSKIGIPWSAMCRCDTIEKSTWVEMKKSGCLGVKIGFESGNQYVIDNIVNKKLNLESARETCRFLIEELGIKVHGTFTLGLPGETRIQMEDTKNFISSIPFTSYQISGCGTMDGTPLDLISKGIRLEKYPESFISEEFLNFSDGIKKLEKLNNEKIV